MIKDKSNKKKKYEVIKFRIISLLCVKVKDCCRDWIFEMSSSKIYPPHVSKEKDENFPVW